MSATVLAAIDAEIATLQRLVPAPTGALGYGRDVSCSTSLSPILSEVDPDSVQGLAEAQVRRFTTARGLTADNPRDGLDLLMYLNRATTQSEIIAMQGELRNEALKDDRLQACTVTVTVGLNRLRVTFRNTAKDPRLGTFTNTLSVTDGAVLQEALG